MEACDTTASAPRIKITTAVAVLRVCSNSWHATSLTWLTARLSDSRHQSSCACLGCPGCCRACGMEACDTTASAPKMETTASVAIVRVLSNSWRAATLRMARSLDAALTLWLDTSCSNSGCSDSSQRSVSSNQVSLLWLQQCELQLLVCMATWQHCSW